MITSDKIAIAISILTFGVIFAFIIINWTHSNRFPYEGEPCEDNFNYEDTLYDMNNESDRVRAEIAYNTYTMENELKGYCKDGKRIGGLR